MGAVAAPPPRPDKDGGGNNNSGSSAPTSAPIPRERPDKIKMTKNQAGGFNSPDRLTGGGR
jgi:hypothetical protein